MNSVYFKDWGPGIFLKILELFTYVFLGFSIPAYAQFADETPCYGRLSPGEIRYLSPGEIEPSFYGHARALSPGEIIPLPSIPVKFQSPIQQIVPAQLSSRKIKAEKLQAFYQKEKKSGSPILTKASFLQLVDFIEDYKGKLTDKFKGLGPGQIIHLSKEETGLPFTVEFYPNGNIYLNMEEYSPLLGQGSFKEVTLTLDYHQVQARAHIVGRTNLRSDQQSVQRMMEIEISAYDSFIGKQGLGQLLDKGFYYNAKNEKVYVLKQDRYEGNLYSQAKDLTTEASQLEVAIDMFRGLLAIHQAGLAHRDIKPDNILIGRLTKAAQGVITDFGLVKKDESGLSGTPGYISPGSFLSFSAGPLSLKMSQANDVFAMGMTLHFLLKKSDHPLHARNVQIYKSFLKGENGPAFLARIKQWEREYEQHSLLAKTTNSHDQKSLEWLVLEMIHPDPSKRISLDEALFRLELYRLELLVRSAGSH